MILKKFDFLSPSITLYFNEDNQHSSIFSGILSIISYTLVFIVGVYYTFEFINRKNLKAYFYNRYIEDAGSFPVNSSSMFNFIQLTDTKTNEEIPFDFSAFRAVGFDEIYSDDYMHNPNIILNVSHWIYGFCNNSTDTKDIGYLINFQNYEKSACIRKYYDKDTKKYYNTDELGFRWPIVEKGCSNRKRTFYGIIILRCDKSPESLKEQGPDCKNETEINDVIETVSLKYQLIDHYTDILNYEMPFTKYFYQITSAISNEIYIVNHLNFNPANMLTHNGVFFDNIIQEKAYFFIQNEKHAIDQSTLIPQGKSTNGCLFAIYLWMQNTLQYYERSYDRLQDILSDIGGISSIVVTTAYLINLLVNKYIILLDTENLVLYTDQNYLKENNTFKKPSILKRANQIMYPPKRTYVFQGKNSSSEEEEESPSSHYKKVKKDGVDIYQNNNTKEETDEQYINRYFQKNNILNKYSKDNNNKGGNHLHNNIEQNTKIYIRGEHNHNRKNNTEINNNSKNETIIHYYSKNNKIEYFDNDKPIRKQNFTWFKFIWYLICCKRNNPKMFYYEEFRSKLISEENIIQSYLDIYKLLQLHNMQIKNIFIRKN